MPRAPASPSTPLTLSTSASRKVRAPEEEVEVVEGDVHVLRRRGAEFTCKLDKESAKPCDSGVKYKGLKTGKHTFTVFATDEVGNEGSSTTFKWKVKKKKG